VVWSAAEKYMLVAAKLYGVWYPDSQGNTPFSTFDMSSAVSNKFNRTPPINYGS